MKLFSLVLITNFLVSSVFGQDIIFNVKSYKGGYNISCNGSADGSIDATIVGGIPPYSYSWSNGATSQDLLNIHAGIYTLTVTDAVGSVKAKSTTLFEPDLIEVFFMQDNLLFMFSISGYDTDQAAILSKKAVFFNSINL